MMNLQGRFDEKIEPSAVPQAMPKGMPEPPVATIAAKSIRVGANPTEENAGSNPAPIRASDFGRD